MANWTLLRALGWAFKSKLLSSEMEAVDDFLTKVPNFQDGSSHTSTDQVILHGAGAEITPFVSDDGDIKIGSGHALEVLNGGAFLADSASIMQVDCIPLFTNDLHFGDATHTGKFLSIAASNYFEIKANAQGLVRGDGIFTVSGTSGHLAYLIVGNFGVLSLQNGATQTVLSGGLLYQDSGSTWQVVSGANINANFSTGSFTIGTGLSCAWSLAGATLNLSSSSTLSLASSTFILSSTVTCTNASTTTRTGPTTRTAGAYWDNRVSSTLGSGVISVDPSDFDVIVLNAASSQVTLSTPANTAIRHKVIVDGWTNNPASFSLKVGVTTVFNYPGGGSGAGCVIYWTGSTWRVCQPTGGFTTP